MRSAFRRRNSDHLFDGWKFAHEECGASSASFSAVNGDRVIHTRRIGVCDGGIGDFGPQFTAVQQEQRNCRCRRDRETVAVVEELRVTTGSEADASSTTSLLSLRRQVCPPGRTGLSS